MNESVASQKTRKKLHRRYSEGLRNQIEGHFVNICKWNNIEIEVTFPIAL